MYPFFPPSSIHPSTARCLLCLVVLHLVQPLDDGAEEVVDLEDGEPTRLMQVEHAEVILQRLVGGLVHVGQHEVEVELVVHLSTLVGSYVRWWGHLVLHAVLPVGVGVDFLEQARDEVRGQPAVAPARQLRGAQHAWLGLGFGFGFGFGLGRVRARVGLGLRRWACLVRVGIGV